jgi:hypothetical protein
MTKTHPESPFTLSPENKLVTKYAPRRTRPEGQTIAPVTPSFRRPETPLLPSFCSTDYPDFMRTSVASSILLYHSPVSTGTKGAMSG